MRILIVSITSILAMFGLVINSSAAQASPWSSHANVRGHLSCSGVTDLVDKVDWRTDAGESGTASLSWVDVSRGASSIIRSLKLVKVQEYSLDLNNLPGDGTTLHLTVTCSSPVGTTSFEDSFPVKRSTFGDGITRHVCANDLNCAL